ncbi:hypothetical protein EJB05_30405, partial [Eragrostis curvula]
MAVAPEIWCPATSLHCSMSQGHPSNHITPLEAERSSSRSAEINQSFSPTTSPADIFDADAKFVAYSRRNFIFPQSFPSAAFDLDGNEHVPAILDIEVYHAVILQVSLKL